MGKSGRRSFIKKALAIVAAAGVAPNLKSTPVPREPLGPVPTEYNLNMSPSTSMSLSGTASFWYDDADQKSDTCCPHCGSNDVSYIGNDEWNCYHCASVFAK
jgi:hypothetical protein